MKRETKGRKKMFANYISNKRLVFQIKNSPNLIIERQSNFFLNGEKKSYLKHGRTLGIVANLQMEGNFWEGRWAASKFWGKEIPSSVLQLQRTKFCQHLNELGSGFFSRAPGKSSAVLHPSFSSRETMNWDPSRAMLDLSLQTWELIILL